jgi:hypothetical protein
MVKSPPNATFWTFSPNALMNFTQVGFVMMVELVIPIPNWPHLLSPHTNSLPDSGEKQKCQGAPETSHLFEIEVLILLKKLTFQIYSFK